MDNSEIMKLGVTLGTLKERLERLQNIGNTNTELEGAMLNFYSQLAQKLIKRNETMRKFIKNLYDDPTNVKVKIEKFRDEHDKWADEMEKFMSTSRKKIKDILK